jgi:hypothetical protein
MWIESVDGKAAYALLGDDDCAGQKFASPVKLDARTTGRGWRRRLN